MRAFRIVLDLLIAILLFVALLWGIFLFVGAYSQHRISLLVNRSVVRRIEEQLARRAGSGAEEQEAIADDLIGKLREAQDDLFDANTVAFLFQFAMFLLVTIGVAVLGLIYSAFRRTQEEAAKAEKRHATVGQQIARFLAARNNTIVLAVKYAWLQVLGQMFLLASGKQRERLRIAVADYQRDVLLHLEDALRHGEGFEERLFISVVLEAAIKNHEEVRRARGAAQGFEREALDRVASMSSECVDLLRDNGEEFVKRFAIQFEEITGEGITI